MSGDGVQPVRQQYPDPDPVDRWRGLLAAPRRDRLWVGEVDGPDVDRSLERPDVPLE